MQFKAQVGNWSTLKKGFKCPLHLDKQARIKVLEHIDNFEDEPLICNFININGEYFKFRSIIDKTKREDEGIRLDLLFESKYKTMALSKIGQFQEGYITVKIKVDPKAKKEEMKKITHKQRKYIYAIMKDISNYTGYDLEEQKLYLKEDFCKEKGYEIFSFSNVSKVMFQEFLEWLGVRVLKFGITLDNSHPKDMFSDTQDYVYLCLKLKKCAVCGKDGDFRQVGEYANGEQIQEHHGDAIGMGRDRRTVDDSENDMISLCGEHHMESHNLGWISFKKKHHLVGVKFNE